MSVYRRFRLGVGDVGSMAVRLDVYECGDTAPQLVGKYRALPRLGSLVGRPEEFRSVLLRELGRVKEEAAAAGAETLIVAGTMSLRSFPGIEALLAEVKETHGIQVRVLDGDEEARLTARGIIAGEPDLPASVALVDIGGGSTEISFAENRRTVFSQSFPAGALNLPRGTDEDLSAALKKIFAPLETVVRNYHPEIAIGSSGTIRSVERVLSAERSDAAPVQHVFFRSQLQSLGSLLSGLSNDALHRHPGVEASRADVLLPGIRIFDVVLELLAVNRFRVSHFSLRHGLLHEWLDRNRALAAEKNV